MPERFLKLPEVKARVALSRASIYAKMIDGRFPKSVSLGARAVAWRETDIEAWMTAREEARPALAGESQAFSAALPGTAWSGTGNLPQRPGARGTPKRGLRAGSLQGVRR